MGGTDRRRDLFRSYNNAADIVGGIVPDQLSRATPCPGFDVEAMVDHVVAVGWRIVAFGRGQEVSVSEFPHVALTDASDQLRQAGHEAVAAWSDDGPMVALVSVPWGEPMTGEMIVNMYLAELATHAWDVALTTGQLGRLDPALAEPALEAARAMLVPELRDAWGQGNPYGAEIAAPADATDWERLAAFMGRPPRP
jgi:uncharacterized protein (TIGR03086 family)